MINNRQNRRRGRGGQRGGPNPTGQRNRGNASQLLEKYKGLARDAQMQGDRVQAEYYLQFADHYHRVLEEINSAKEDRQQQNQQQPKPKSSKQRDNDDDGDDQPQQQEKPKRQRKPKNDDGGAKADDTAPKKRGRPKKSDDSIAADALPPAISSDEADAA